ncbi:hypothetical protein V5L74_002078 [Enterobacter hormaechei]
MSEKLFKGGRKPESVAYDMALAMASRDPDTLSAYDLLRRIKQYYPDCLEAAKELHEQETEKPFPIDIKFP